MATGRPREFDADAALDAAVAVFWEKGFEEATIDDLTAAMGINRPSLYAAFGNKEELFRKALDRYANGAAGYVRKALEKPTAREAAEALLRGSVELLANPKNPGGCLVVQAALPCGSATDAVHRELTAVRRSGLEVIRKRLEVARSAGDLPADADCATLARYLATVMHGLAVQAAGGATRREMTKVAEWAMRNWPA
jgi:AcrR family transcriptional regulator